MTPEADQSREFWHMTPPWAWAELILDERLTSAAAPFLYMLSVVLIASRLLFYLFFLG